VNLLERIELNPKVCNGKPVVKGTRIPVSVIIELVAEGYSWDKILAGYPELTNVLKKSYSISHSPCPRTV
jgi:uncharacterized protein (DUF433 family)